MADDKAKQDDAGAADGGEGFDEDAKAAGWVGSSKDEIVAPDGHVTLSKEDIKNRA